MSECLQEGDVLNFSALVGVTLEDVPEEFCGNLCVFPRSHWVIQDYFENNGVEDVEQRGQEAFPRHMPFAPPVQVVNIVIMCV